MPLPVLNPAGGMKRPFGTLRVFEGIVIPFHGYLHYTAHNHKMQDKEMPLGARALRGAVAGLAGAARTASA